MENEWKVSKLFFYFLPPPFTDFLFLTSLAAWKAMVVLTESDQWRWEDKMFRGWVSVSMAYMSCWSKVGGYVGQDEDCCKNEDKSNLHLYRRPEHNECFKLWTGNLTNTIMIHKDDEQNKNNEKCLSSHSEK